MTIESNTTCPSCKETHNEYGENPDGSITCFRCDMNVRPDWRGYFLQDKNTLQQEDKIVDKMIEKVNSLRSCIITLQDGQCITLSFPKELENPTHLQAEHWRSRLRSRMREIACRCFSQFYEHIESVTFDDEV